MSQHPFSRPHQLVPRADTVNLASLPGGDLIVRGLADLARGEASVPALLVSVGAPRLGRAGVDVPRPVEDPELRLYEALRGEDSHSAHSRYNALIRRLVSFERALECGI